MKIVHVDASLSAVTATYSDTPPSLIPYGQGKCLSMPVCSLVLKWFTEGNVPNGLALANSKESIVSHAKKPHCTGREEQGGNELGVTSKVVQVVIIDPRPICPFVYLVHGSSYTPFSPHQHARSARI